MSSKPCTWQSDEDGNWHTECGEIFVIIDGTPTENKMRYCPYCGGGLMQAKRVVYRKSIEDGDK